MNDEWERMWKEAVVTYFKVLYKPGGTEEHHKICTKGRWSLGWDSNLELPECKVGMLNTQL
jgi:hypothetical protein